MSLFNLFLFMNLFIGVYVYSMMFKHLLSVLLSLEFMVVVVFLLFMIFLSQYSFYYSLVYLVMSVCEGALGLSILVIMGRSHGGDYFNSFNLMIN